MTKQPSPLLALADRIEEANECPMVVSIHAATELRRLHGVNVLLGSQYDNAVKALCLHAGVNTDLLATMRHLACLGNGDQYGNSDGNIIAQVALNRATGETE